MITNCYDSTFYSIVLVNNVTSLIYWVYLMLTSLDSLVVRGELCKSTFFPRENGFVHDCHIVSTTHTHTYIHAGLHTGFLGPLSICWAVSGAPIRHEGRPRPWWLVSSNPTPSRVWACIHVRLKETTVICARLEPAITRCRGKHIIIIIIELHYLMPRF